MRPGLSIAPAMQAIVVDCVPVVDPQLAAVIRDNAETNMTCPEVPHAAGPTCCKVISAMEPVPRAACVSVIDRMSPTPHVWLAVTQTLAMATLTEVESVLHEETMSISGAMHSATPASCVNNHPAISSVSTPVPEKHAGMSAVFEHLEAHKAPMRAQKPCSLTVAPTMQAIVVDRVPILDPQLTSIVRNYAEPVMGSSVNPHATCPPNSKVIVSGKTRPSAACVAVVHCVSPTSHVWSATPQVRATTTLSEIENIFSEKCMTIGGVVGGRATCVGQFPTIPRVRMCVSEPHTSMTAALKHLQSHEMPTSTHISACVSVAPAMQAIVVDGVSIVNPQLASIVRNDAE
jgi:hypothetical protein